MLEPHLGTDGQLGDKIEAPVEPVEPEIPPVKYTFKSRRAAAIANGKATRAWEAARSARIDKEHELRPLDDDDRAVLAPFEAAEKAWWQKMNDVYASAKAQGFYVNNRHLHRTATDDLIAANMD